MPTSKNAYKVRKIKNHQAKNPSRQAYKEDIGASRELQKEIIHFFISTPHFCNNFAKSNLTLVIYNCNPLINIYYEKSSKIKF